MGKFMVCIGNFFLKNVLSIFSFVFILFVIADDDKLNPWMLAMIGIGGVFIAFVGVSIYLMCKTTNQEMARSCTTMGT